MGGSVSWWGTSVSRLFVILVVAVLTACAKHPPADVLAPGRFQPWDASLEEYRLRPGDELDVRLIHNPEFSDRVIVSPDGQISMPLVGFVPAAGRTPRELQAELQGRFRRELRQPDVSVIPRTFAQQRVFIGGEVGTPGVYDLPSQIGVLQAVITAGGFRPTAREDGVILIRRTPQNRPAMRLVNVESMLDRGALDEDIPLQPFDVVFVPRSGIAQVGWFVDQFIRQVLPVQPGIAYSLN